MGVVSSKAGFTMLNIPERVRIHRRGNLLIALDYGSEPRTLIMPGEVLLDPRNLQPQRVTILHEIKPQSPQS